MEHNQDVSGSNLVRAIEYIFYLKLVYPIEVTSDIQALRSWNTVNAFAVDAAATMSANNAAYKFFKKQINHLALIFPELSKMPWNLTWPADCHPDLQVRSGQGEKTK